jgi:hypothetical protein
MTSVHEPLTLTRAVTVPIVPDGAVAVEFLAIDRIATVAPDSELIDSIDWMKTTALSAGTKSPGKRARSSAVLP